MESRTVFSISVHCSAVHMLPTFGRKIRSTVIGSALGRRKECLQRVGKPKRVTTKLNSNFVLFGPVSRSGLLSHHQIARKCATVSYSDTHISDIVTQGTKTRTQIFNTEGKSFLGLLADLNTRCEAHVAPIIS